LPTAIIFAKLNAVGAVFTGGWDILIVTNGMIQEKTVIPNK
jgi:hypothetical protein